MKIALAVNELDPANRGGIGVFYMALARGLVAHGHSVKFISVGVPSDTDSDFSILWVAPLNARWVGRILSRAKFWALCTWWYLRKEFDVLELPEYQGWLPLPTLFPVVVRLHGAETTLQLITKGRVNRLTRVLERLTIDNADRVISVSLGVAEAAERNQILRRSTSLVYNPVILTVPFIPVPRKKWVLFAGTVSRSKGAVRLAEAVRRVRTRFPDVELIYAGRVPSNATDVRAEILVQVGETGVRFLGPLRPCDLHRLMMECACLVLPSASEAFGMVVAEAMAYGLPPIYSAGRPGTEIVRSGEDGLLCNPMSVDEIAACISSLLGDEVLAGRISEKGRSAARERFSLDQCVDKSIDIYSNV